MTETENRIMQFLGERESNDLYMLATKLHVHGGSGVVFAESLDICVDAVMSLLADGKIERKAKELPSTGWLYSIVKQQQAVVLDGLSYGILKKIQEHRRRSRRDLVKDFISYGVLAPCTIEKLYDADNISIAVFGECDWFDVYELTERGRNLIDSSEMSKCRKPKK